MQNNVLSTNSIYVHYVICLYLRFSYVQTWKSSGYIILIVYILNYGNLVWSYSGLEIPLLPQTVVLNTLICIFLNSNQDFASVKKQKPVKDLLICKQLVGDPGWDFRGLVYYYPPNNSV